MSLAFVRGIHRWPVNSPDKGPVTWKIFPFDGVIMQYENMRNVDKQTQHVKTNKRKYIYTQYEHFYKFYLKN